MSERAPIPAFMMRSGELTGDGAPSSQAADRQSRLLHKIAVSAELIAASGCDPAAALRTLDCTDAGLDDADAAARLKRYTWLGNSLGFVPLPPLYWPAVLAIIGCYAVLTQLMKTWFVRRWGM
jgi:hypothetical protein